MNLLCFVFNARDRMKKPRARHGEPAVEYRSGTGPRNPIKNLFFAAAGVACCLSARGEFTGHEAPRPEKKPRDVSVHGDKRIDEYFWLREKDNPALLAHLKAENAHT